jgi:hypothetical protein
VLGELVERLAGDAAHDLAEDLEVDVAVAKDVARLVDRLLLQDQLHRRVVAAPGIGVVEVGAQSRGVGQQVADGDVGMRELGDESLRRIVEADLPALDQQPDGRRGGHDLRQRRSVEDRVDGHRLDVRHQRAVAVRFLVDLCSGRLQPAGIVAGPAEAGPYTLEVIDAARDFLLRDGALDGGVDLGEHRRGAPQRARHLGRSTGRAAARPYADVRACEQEQRNDGDEFPHRRASVECALRNVHCRRAFCG